MSSREQHPAVTITENADAITETLHMIDLSICGSSRFPADVGAIHARRRLFTLCCSIGFTPC